MPTGITINSPVVCLIVYYVRVNSYGKSRTSRRYNAGHCKGNRIAGNIACNTAARVSLRFEWSPVDRRPFKAIGGANRYS
jgi:hypothetical protein